ncbi:hypothetical protein ABID99_003642 [Mucilaginibacter sp. OAE612]|uniref:glycosyl hydrolase n=1 Tax=Mucilaginibacter sp. OAE612 TaxID=3156444 RepID=UPI00359EE8A8
MMKVSFVVTTCVLLFYTCRAQSPKSQFVWGINGHPLTQKDYSNNLDDQITALKDLNVSSYRFDVILTKDGYAKNQPAFMKLLQTLKQNNILPFAAVMQTGVGGMLPDSVYQIAFSQGKNFGVAYGDYFTVLEVNNEVDNKIRVRNVPDGVSPDAGYDIEKSKRFMAQISGFIDGVKTVKPSIKISLSVSFTHFYYLELLKENKVNYDIIGCHWYSNMGDMLAQKLPIANVLSYIQGHFNKPIWITEFNRFKGTGAVSFAMQSQYITDNIPKLIAQKKIGAFFVYELFDEQSLSAKFPLEANYGIMYKDASGNYVKKDSYYGYKGLIYR